jgi:hypothetical protein
VDMREQDHQVHLQFAENVLWLLHSKVGATELDGLRGRYFNLLFKRDLVREQRVRISKLQTLLNKHYSAELLEALHCSFGRRSHWLSRLVQTSRSAHHPIHHLLVMQSLGCSPEVFFNAPAKFQPSTKPFTKGMPSRQTRRGKEKEAPSVTAEKQATYREQWKRTVEENPGSSRNTIRYKIPTAYNWLMRRDKQWLEQNSPAKLKHLGPPALIDWAKRDAKLAAEVRTIYERLINAPGRPIRVSRTAIAREMRQVAAIFKSADKLPLTNKALDELGESIESYAIRRVRWATECFRRENVRANYWQLLTKAAVGYDIAKRPAVKAAFDAAVASLDPINESVRAAAV